MDPKYELLKALSNLKVGEIMDALNKPLTMVDFIKMTDSDVKMGYTYTIKTRKGGELTVDVIKTIKGSLIHYTILITCKGKDWRSIKVTKLNRLGSRYENYIAVEEYDPKFMECLHEIAEWEEIHGEPAPAYDFDTV